MGDLWLGWLISVAAGGAFAYAALATIFTRKGRASWWRPGKFMGGLCLWLAVATIAYFFLSIAAYPALEARGIRLPYIWWPLVAGPVLLWLADRLGATE